MAENYDLIFGQSASQQYAWSDSDYQNGWQTVGSTPPTAEQFDALQRRNDTKAQDLNSRLTPLETKATADGRQAATEYEEGDMVTADGLPNGWLLECVVPGTTDTGALVIPSPLVIGGTIVDGTVTWKLLNLALSGIPVGYITPFLQSDAPDGWLACQGAEVSRTAYPDLWNFVNGSSQLISESDWQAKNTSGEKNIGWFSTGDGTTTFRLPRIVGSGELTEVKRFTTAGSGSFVAPITGIYRITLQGAGGGGAGGSNYGAGNGGGQGGNFSFYEKLTAGTSYSFTIGAGGTAGAVATTGGDGGASSITVNSNVYEAGGGGGGIAQTQYDQRLAGYGGKCKINNTVVGQGAAGQKGSPTISGTFYVYEAPGGGPGGSNGVAYGAGILGGGGYGGRHGGSDNYAGSAGGDGYIEFAFNPVPQYWYVRAFGSATNQGTVDITALANMLNAKLSISSVPLIAGYNGKQTFTSSGSFVAPITGIYRITLQGAGGGGSNSYTSAPDLTGGGGGQGGHFVFYEQLEAGTTYAYTIGAGGRYGNAGNAGGDSSITVNSHVYAATGGGGGSAVSGTYGGQGTLDGVYVAGTRGASNRSGSKYSTSDTRFTCGGNGAGEGGGGYNGGVIQDGVNGGGGAGGFWNGSSYVPGSTGGDGYITFEWLDTSLL